MSLVRVFVVLWITFLSGCAVNTLPEFSESKAVLLIPKILSNSSSETWLRRYRLTFVSSTDEYDIWIDNGADDFQIVDDIPVGSYTLKSIKWKVASGWRAHHSMDEGLVLDIPVVLRAGSLTLLPGKLLLSQYDRGSTVYSQYGLRPLSDEDHSNIIEALNAEQRNAKWVKSILPKLSYWVKSV